MVIGERLRKLRQDRHLSVQQIANELGITRQYVYYIENGKQKPSMNLLEKYASFFHVTLDYLTGTTNNNPIPVFHLENFPLQSSEKMILPSSCVEDDKDYFAVYLEDESLAICEKSTELDFERLGLFKYDKDYFFTKLRRCRDGSVWLISLDTRSPKVVEQISEVRPIGYCSYQLHKH